MTSIVSVLEHHEYPWHEVQQISRDRQSWRSVFTQPDGKSIGWRTAKEALNAFDRIVKNLALVGTGITYRIVCPRSRDVVWQGTPEHWLSER